MLVIEEPITFDDIGVGPQAAVNLDFMLQLMVHPILVQLIFE